MRKIKFVIFSGQFIDFGIWMARTRVCVPDAEELSGIGAAYLAGIALGIFDRSMAFGNLHYREYVPVMDDAVRDKRYKGWLDAVDRVLSADL